uniref:TSA: Wollemia nobilis Ref_Wollemi_Transcript_21707_3593 transcribed RNA sequence n=1 Tax=Wollemia nobilis TaxID=56998 RepID=A0A0C9QMT8_9CONI
MKMGFRKGFLLVIFTFLLAITPAFSAVCSIDLGLESMKVAVVNLKPGQSPISIAINEMSKRKSPALVAFNGGNRLVGEEAAGISARYPDKVFAQIRDMLGKSYEQVKSFADSLYLPYDIVEDSRGAGGIRIDDGKSVYSAEELVSMILSYGRHLAESHAKAPVMDAVICVPPFFGQAERNAIIQAAQLAGISVLSLINEHSGAALQYGIDKDFSNASRHVVFYDMGSNSVYAALVYFSAYTTKEYGKTVTVNQFQVKDVRWNAKLGGQTMELRLVEFFADEFNKKLGNGVDIRKSPKAMAKLKKQVKRTKEILSANSEAPLSVESLYDDRDFRSTITRQKFEELCGGIWEEALVPLKEVIKNSGLKVQDLYAVELIGGATRVPKLQVILQEFLGRKDLDKHLDADEAVVLGAALHAANMSDGIKLNRKLGMIDGASYGILLELNSPELDNENNQQVLIPRMKKLPSKVFKSVTYSKDFEVTLLYDPSDILPPGVSSGKIAKYQVSGLTDAHSKYASRNLSSPIKTNLHFSLSRSGVVSFDRAETVIEVSEWIEVPVKNLTVENTTSAQSHASTESSSNPDSSIEKEDGNLSGKDIENNTGSTNPHKETEDAKPITEKKLRKRTFRVPLKVIDVTDGPGRSLSKESFSEAGIRLADLSRQDAERKRTAELKNTLEEYIYSTKEKLDSSEDILKISTEEQRESFKGKLDEAQEWLYTDGEDASADEFQRHLDSLKSIGDPIFLRLAELSARPIASDYFRQYLSGLHKTLDEWEKKKPWIEQSLKDEVLNEADKIKKWLEEYEAKQAITPGYMPPMFTSDEVYRKLEKLEDKVIKISKIPKPKPKIEKPAKVDSQEETKSSSSNRTEDGDGGENTHEPNESAQQSEDSDGQQKVDDEPFDEL